MCAKFTLIEPHIHNLQFEPSVTIGDENEVDEGTKGEESTGKSKAKMAVQGFLTFLVMFAVLWAIFSRITGTEDNDIDN